jgi:hypothetical protein
MPCFALMRSRQKRRLDGGRIILICPMSDFPKSCQAPQTKIIRFSRNANQRYGCVIPCLTEGRIAIVTTRRLRDVMDVPGSQTSEAGTDGETVWS